jgi:hypothetical protein
VHFMLNCLAPPLKGDGAEDSWPLSDHSYINSDPPGAASKLDPRSQSSISRR